MVSKSKVIWTIKELTEIIRQRQLNEYDINIGVSGARGDGKSTIINKILNHFKKDGFNQKKHQVYKREDVIDLLANQTFSFCWDDEAINSGYKRDFQSKAQKELIKIVTAYRDNYNIYASALPFFYALDVGLRELIFLHIHIIERGIAVLLLPLEDQIHSQDPWDTANNKKVEEKYNKRLQKNPKAKFPYPELSTYAGYIFFGDLTKKQKEFYKKIKREKRGKAFNNESVIIINDESPLKKLYVKLLDGKLTRKDIKNYCFLNDKKYNDLRAILNKMLKDDREERTVQDFLIPEEESTIHNKCSDELDELIPDFK